MDSSTTRAKTPESPKLSSQMDDDFVVVGHSTSTVTAPQMRADADTRRGAISGPSKESTTTKIDQDKQVEKANKPAPAVPAEHYIHTDFLQFVRTGIIDPSSIAYLPVGASSDNTVASPPDYSSIEGKQGVPTPEEFHEVLHLSRPENMNAEAYEILIDDMRCLQGGFTTFMGGEEGLEEARRNGPTREQQHGIEVIRQDMNALRVKLSGATVLEDRSDHGPTPLNQNAATVEESSSSMSVLAQLMGIISSSQIMEANRQSQIAYIKAIQDIQALRESSSNALDLEPSPFVELAELEFMQALKALRAFKKFPELLRQEDGLRLQHRMNDDVFKSRIVELESDPVMVAPTNLPTDQAPEEEYRIHDGIGFLDIRTMTGPMADLHIEADLRESTRSHRNIEDRGRVVMGHMLEESNCSRQTGPPFPPMAQEDRERILESQVLEDRTRSRQDREDSKERERWRQMREDRI